MFERDLFAELTNSTVKKRKLKHDAVPTVFNHAMAVKQKAVRRRLCSEDRNAKKAKKEITLKPQRQNRGTQVFVDLKDACTQTEQVDSKCLCDVQLSGNLQTPLGRSTPAKRSLSLELNVSEELELSSIEDDVTHDPSYLPEESETDSSSFGSSNSDRTGFDTSQPPQTDSKFIIFESCLSQLFNKCLLPNCCEKLAYCKKRTMGSLLVVETTCSMGHECLWNSQPVINRMAAGNLLSAAALLFTGSTFGQISNFAKTLRLNFFSEKTYFSIQDKQLFPVVNNAWQMEQASVVSQLQGQKVWLCGDGRCDSPGFCAKYCNYTMMDMHSGKVVAYNIVQVTEIGSSTNMEKLGFTRCLEEVKGSLDVKVLATDRHLQIGKVMKDEIIIQHQYDMWHFAKSFGKKLGQVTKRKECSALGPWMRSITNHVWWSTATCEEDEVILKEKFLSIVHHISNIHEWQSADKYHRCAHDPLGEEYMRSKKWIKPGTPPHKALQDVMFNTRLLNQLKKLTMFCHTGDLEVFHSLLLKYCPKRQHFSYKGMHARQQLAILDHNNNTGRQQAVNGEKRYNLVFTKMTKQWVAKPVKEKKDYSYLDNMLDTVITNRVNNLTLPSVTVPALPKSIATKERPDKKQTIDKHNSRMGKQLLT